MAFLSGIPRRDFVPITASAVPKPALLLFQVSNAAKFLTNPKIAPSPLAQKRAFLKSKGLTDAQIEMACHQAGISSNEENVASSLVVERVPETRVSGTCSTMEKWVEGKLNGGFSSFFVNFLPHI